MPFDPNIPADDSWAYAVELRNQFIALNDSITAKPSMADVTNAISTLAARNMDNVAQLNIALHDPVTRAEGQAIIDKINEMLSASHS